MKPLRIALKDRTDDILRVTAEKGQFQGMRFAGVRDYIAFTRWLKEVTGSETYGLRPANPDSLCSDSWTCHQAWMERHTARLSLLKRKADLEREIEEVEQEIRMWEWKILNKKVQLCEVI